MLMHIDVSSINLRACTLPNYPINTSGMLVCKLTRHERNYYLSSYT